MNIIFIGGGNMASAMVEGLLKQGVPPGDVQVIDVSPEARARFANKGIATHAQWRSSLQADVVVFAVKPQQMKSVVTDLQAVSPTALLISIAAGIRSAQIAHWLGGHPRVVRAMPNMPALIGDGISGLYATAGVNDADRQITERILGAAGKIVWFAEERKLDAVTAVSGSGPAYVFYLMEALEEAAMALDIDGPSARALAIQTFLGASKLAAVSADSPAVLRAKVTSKGGTTERALESMETAGIKSNLIEAVRQAELRARELGDEFGTK